MTTHLVVGPEAHGVVRCALDLHATPALGDDPLVRLDQGPRAELAADLVAAAEGSPAHLHVTDRLFGTPASVMADALEILAAAGPMTVTLHDIPQPSDGAEAYARRAAAYARVVAAARGVVVSSHHESLLLDDALERAGRGDLRGAQRAVVPLPIDPPANDAAPARTRAASPAGHRDLGVLGFLYPGKGHEEALEALAALPRDVGLVAIGRPSAGHGDLAAALAARAAELGRRCRVTGFVPDAELAGWLNRVAVPVAPHRHLSASGSINTWLSAGRRPLVPRGRYATELGERCPGALWLYDDLGEACAAALDDPAATWLAPGVRVGPSRQEAAAAYADLLARWAA